MISQVKHDIIVWYHIWYHVWYGFTHSLGHVILRFFHDIPYDIMSFWRYHMTQRMGKTISHMTSYMMSCNFAWYHHYVISHNCDIIELYDVICDITWVAAGWRRRWLRPPWSSTSSSASLAVAYELGGRIHLHWYGLDSSIGLVATLAASIVNGGCFVIIEKGWWTLTAHACIAHNTDILPKHLSTQDSSLWGPGVRGRRWKHCSLVHDCPCLCRGATGGHAGGVAKCTNYRGFGNITLYSRGCHQLAHLDHV
jgi:hypothetical protein